MISTYDNKPYTGKERRKKDRRQKKDYKEMETDELRLLMSEIAYSESKKGNKLTRKELKERAIKALKEKWGEKGL